MKIKPIVTRENYEQYINDNDPEVRAIAEMYEDEDLDEIDDF